jgi:hypothetical protein
LLDLTIRIRSAPRSRHRQLKLEVDNTVVSSRDFGGVPNVLKWRNWGEFAAFSWWSLRQELNLYFALRRHAFYPLNYGEEGLEVCLILVNDLTLEMLGDVQKYRIHGGSRR